MSVAARQGTTASSVQRFGRSLLVLQTRVPVLQILATVGVFTYGAVSLPGLASWESVRLILVVASLSGLAAVGQTLLILIGGFDLSIAGFLVSSALIVTQLRESYGMPFVVALAIAIAGAAVLGAAAGYVCHRFEIQPLIVTLATGTIAVGLTQTMLPGGLTYGAGAPGWLVRLCSPATKTFGIALPPMVAIWALVAVGMSVFLHRTVAGRYLLATGANPRGAEYSLVNTRRVWTLAFAFSAVSSALVGLLVAGFGGSVSTASGDPFLFLSVIAVLVGGTVFGGPGDYARTVVGALFVTVVDVVLVGHGASAADQQMLYGAAIVIAVSLYSRQRSFSDRI